MVLNLMPMRLKSLLMRLRVRLRMRLKPVLNEPQVRLKPVLNEPQMRLKMRLKGSTLSVRVFRSFLLLS
jgi:hypothetical protein